MPETQGTTQEKGKTAGWAGLVSRSNQWLGRGLGSCRPRTAPDQSASKNQDSEKTSQDITGNLGAKATNNLQRKIGLGRWLSWWVLALNKALAGFRDLIPSSALKKSSCGSKSVLPA